MPTATDPPLIVAVIDGIDRWMGHRPSTPGGLPCIGPASGCFRGFALADLAVAALVVDTAHATGLGVHLLR